MEKYSTYSTEDFLMDELFLDWIFAPSETTEGYWNAIFARYPVCKPKADEARKILLTLRIKPGKPMPPKMRQQVITHLQTHMDDVVTKERNGRTSRSWKRYLAVAGIVACCTISYILYRNATNSPVADQATLSQTNLPTNQTEQITNTTEKPLLLLLPDTSTVILEAKAYVIYHKESFLTDREVYLSGEAFFEVKSEKDHPFVVKTDHLTTKVLGTSFRVKAAKTLAESKVTVRSGIVEVRKKIELDSTAMPDPVYLTANQELTYSVTISEQPLRPLTPSAITPPTFDEHFKATPLKEVLKRLSDQYQVDISVADPFLETRTITASFQDMHLFEKLELISRATEANYRIVDGKVIFFQRSFNP